MLVHTVNSKKYFLSQFNLVEIENAQNNVFISKNNLLYFFSFEEKISFYHPTLFVWVTSLHSIKYCGWIKLLDLYLHDFVSFFNNFNYKIHIFFMISKENYIYIGNGVSITEPEILNQSGNIEFSILLDTKPPKYLFDLYEGYPTGWNIRTVVDYKKEQNFNLKEVRDKNNLFNLICSTNNIYVSANCWEGHWLVLSIKKDFGILMYRNLEENFGYHLYCAFDPSSIEKTKAFYFFCDLGYDVSIEARFVMQKEKAIYYFNKFLETNIKPNELEWIIEDNLDAFHY